MNVLIDTHIFLWYILADERLRDSKKKTIEDNTNRIYLSVASIWECVIKNQIGKLNFPKKASEYLIEKRNQHFIRPLEITEDTISALENLPLLHKDPFDRIIISQALENNLKLISEDTLILNYKLPIFI
jgi:PIN domain nuclease of toxin-antitoxin system